MNGIFTLHLLRMGKAFFRFLFLVLIITWLVKSEYVDFTLIFQLKHHLYLIPVTISLLVLSFIVSTYRLKSILELKTKTPIPASKLFAINSIGQFFNIIIPGATGGDLIKIGYTKKLHPHLSVSFLLVAAITDRVFGLLGLCIIQGTSSLLYYSNFISASPEIKLLLIINYCVFAAVLLLICSLLIPVHWQHNVLNFIIKFLPGGKFISEILSHFWLIGSCKVVFLKSICFGVISQLLIISCIYLVVLPFASGYLPFQYSFIFFPIGIISTIIPISPMGIGVGHIAFNQIFSFLNIRDGASLFNLFMILEIFTNLIGGVFYIFYRSPLESAIPSSRLEINDYQKVKDTN